MQIKPRKDAFLLGSIFPSLLTLVTVAFISVVASAVTPYSFLLLVPLVCLLLLGFIIYRETIVYSKEDYEIREDRILVRRGGIFSDSETELQLEHVTHVKLILPWIRHKLFATGIIQVEAAGSAANEVIFRDVEHPQRVYDHIQKQLHKSGFCMSTDSLLHREGPADVGIVAELLLSGMGTILGIAFLGWPLLIGALTIFPGIIFLLPLIIALGIAVLVLHYLDLKRRTYSIYNGLIDYHEGFLTKKDAIIPVENISNSEVTRNIVDRLTDLYQVKVSCQGAGQEIRFRHLKHGEKFNSTVKRLVDEQSGRSETSARPPETGKSRIQGETFTFSRDTETTAEYGMHLWRTMLPLLLCYILLPVLLYIFPLFLLLVGFTVYELVRVRNTTYFLNKNSVQEKFEFFTSKSREFSTDKITGVTFRENILDKRLNTCSVKFWSIGAAEDITFRNIPKSEHLQDIVLAKAGIYPGETFYTFNSEFSLAGMIMANLPVIAGLVLLLAAGPVLAVLYQPVFAGISLLGILVPVVWYSYASMYYPRSRLSLYDNSLEFRRGLIVDSVTHALYPNVKDISTTKYPFLDTGQMRFNIAGERIKKTQYGEVRTPNGFSVNYVPGILNKDDVFDRLLLGRKEQLPQPEQPLMTSGKAASNTVFAVVVGSVLLFPLLVLLPLSLGIAVWKARRVRYIIEPERVLMRKGVLYRKQTSIIFDRIDHIQTGQNFLNKLFKNGNILIYTAGSSRPELVLRDIRNHTEFHRQLRNYY